MKRDRLVMLLVLWFDVIYGVRFLKPVRFSFPLFQIMIVNMRQLQIKSKLCTKEDDMTIVFFTRKQTTFRRAQWNRHPAAVPISKYLKLKI